jgi:hypothetical protein
MLEVPLSATHTLLLDEIDKPILEVFKWRLFLSGTRKKAYVATWIGPSMLYMHRLLLGAQKGQEIDHINGNGTDNRRKNLRFCTRAENTQNVSGWGKRLAKHSAEHPVYKGVWAISRSNGRSNGRIWEAKLCFDGKQRYIGTFELPELAALAYDDWARCFHGRSARLNFPGPGEMGVHDRQAK